MISKLRDVWLFVLLSLFMTAFGQPVQGTERNVY